MSRLSSATSSRRSKHGRPTGPRTAKVSVSVDAKVLRDAQVVARRAGTTLSAHVSEALARDLRRRRLQDLIAAYEAEHDVITDAELAKARAAWQG